ncbi:uncharacterized protein LOC143179069, partial [Calliopsis andreniformis]|uniref:uncharacterized protein LOC143179069 n=1 Tax=Calliopsis andreniformis TaxID=337506 RepID=UPI003FCECEAD
INQYNRSRGLNVTSRNLADLRRKRTKFESPYLRSFSLRRHLIERKQFSNAYAQKWEQLLVQQRDTLNAAIDQVSQFRGQLLQEEQISQKMTRTRNARHN